MVMPQVMYDLVRMNGGWDQVTPTLALAPGVLRDVLNFECAPTGGYSRIGGYERVDGRTAPSAASYLIVQVVAFTNTPTVGQTLTGFSSGATGIILALATNYIVLTKIVGTFTAVEVVKVGATVIGTATTQTASITAKQAAQYTALAATNYRADIGKVPGSGAVLGVAALVVSGVDNLYAWRANAGNTAVDLYKTSGSGWTQVAFKNEVSFTAGGTATPADGATLTQGGVTAIVRRVMASSGAWTGTAAGRFIIDNPAGGNFAGGAATLTGGATVTLTAIQTAITMAVGGRMEFVVANFSGQLSTLRLYGVDGVNRMFEFDGTTLAPIVTGVTPDQPKHVSAHKNFLFCSVQSSIFYSGVGTPFRWLAVDGGGEIATGATVTGFLVQPGAQATAALAVYGRTQTAMLYGTGSTTWNFVIFNTRGGALDYGCQNLSQSYVFDNPGVISLQATLNYGNFTQATLTNGIITYVNDKRTKLIASSINRSKSQYRAFFNDGYGLYGTIVNGKVLGFTQVNFPTPVYCAWSSMLSTGAEVQYVGMTDGYVQQLDMGSSFDGASLDAFCTFNWNAMKSPRVLKRFRKASIEMQGNFYAEVSFGYSLGYATSTITQPSNVVYPSNFTPAPNWDTFTWDSFTWDGTTLAPTETGMVGTAENVQITISSTGDYIYPFTLNSLIVHYTPRRGLR